MRIQGDLATYEFSNLLQWLAQGRKTGVLVLADDSTEHRLGFERGRIVMSASNRPEMHLDNYLLEQGLIDEATLTRAHRLRQATQMLSGQVLVTLGALSEQDLGHALRFKTEEILCDLLTWRKGTYVFHGGEQPAAPTVDISLDVTHLLLESMHRLDQLKAKSREPKEEEPAKPASRPQDAQPTSPPVATAAPADGLALAEVIDPAGAEAAPEPGGDAATVALPDPELPSYYGAAEPQHKRVRRLMPLAAVLTLAIGAGSYYLVNREATAEAAKPAGRPIIFTRAPRPPLEFRYAADVRSEPVESAVDGAAVEAPPGVDRRQTADGEVEEALRARYEGQLAELRRQLEEARQEAARAEPPPARRSDVAQGRAEAAPVPQPAAPQETERASAAPTSGSSQRAAEPASKAAEPASKAAEPAPTAAEPAPQAAEPTPQAAEPIAEPRPAAARTAAPSRGPIEPPGGPEARPEVEERAVSRPAAPPPPPAAVEAPIPSTPPRLISRPSPRFPPAARRLARSVTVTVRVLVGVDGRVQEVERVGRKAGLGLDQAAAEAALESRWHPGAVDGEPAPQWIELRFEFTP